MNTQTQSPEQTVETGFGINDLAVLKSAIEVATQRGAFQAEEMATVGAAYNKLAAFLENIAAQAQKEQQAQEQQAQTTESTPKGGKK